MSIVTRVPESRYDDEGLVADRPANGAVPDGSYYYATDVDGGQLYKMVGGVWTARGPAVNDSNDSLLDYVELATQFTPASPANGVDIDITGLTLTVVSGVRPIMFRAKLLVQPSLGTAASPSVIRHQVKLRHNSDNAGTWVTRDTDTRATKVATGEIYYNGHVPEWTYTPAAAGETVQVKVALQHNTANSAFTVHSTAVSVRSFLQAVQR